MRERLQGALKTGAVFRTEIAGRFLDQQPFCVSVAFRGGEVEKRSEILCRKAAQFFNPTRNEAL